jgi:hypothetical protein
MAFQDLGYFKVLVNDPRVSFDGQEKNLRNVDVAIMIEEGLQYRLGEIQFQNATVFSSNQMRKLFPIHAGDLFNRAKIAEGLNELGSLYDTEGYINCVATPDAKSDDLHHTISQVIDLDEGKPFNFGQLVLDGKEPHPGAGKALVESWKTLQRPVCRLPKPPAAPYPLCRHGETLGCTALRAPQGYRVCACWRRRERPLRRPHGSIPYNRCGRLCNL